MCDILATQRAGERMLESGWMLGKVTYVVFFFQAEDGIRDLTVTGVQTCALPIWLRPREGARRNRSTRSRRPWMRRTTICRSERAALLALVAGLLGGLAPAAAAQDTTQARPDTLTPVPDTSQAAPAPAPLGQLPATHVVATGETLWSIAQLYC